MAISTGNRELLRHVVWINCGIVIIGVTTSTRVGRIAVVTLMAVIAAHTGMCSYYRIKRVVERGWRPGCLVVAIGTGGRELLRHVIRIRGGIEIVSMAARTSIGCIIVITIVAGGTIIGYSRMSSE